MEELMELLTQIQELAGIGLDSLAAEAGAPVEGEELPPEGEELPPEGEEFPPEEGA